MSNRVGDMNKRITLEAPVKIPDGMGGFSSTFAAVPKGSNIPAQAWTTSSTEVTTGDAINVIRVQKFKIWYRTVLKGSWRVKWGTRIFSITAADPDDKNLFIYLTCKEVA
jgi:SPP1 family predicted phage head-tail adaptor